MDEQDLQIMKLKRMIKFLDQAKGNGTSMVTLIIPSGSAIAQSSKLLVQELGTASNIKSRVNKLSVLSAITSAQQKLKLYNKTPPNGLAIFCGEASFDEDKDKKISIAFEPHKPLTQALYLCDSKFHTDCLKVLLNEDRSFGYIVIDGDGCLFGIISGLERKVLLEFDVDLPKKHNKGGQSAVRFGRLRDEKRHNYVRKCSETANQLFINLQTNKPNISGLVLAGLADFKHDLVKEEIIDKRLRDIVVGFYDISYGGLNGFNQAIELSSQAVQNTKLIAEKKVLDEFFLCVKLGKNVVYGEADTLNAFDIGAVDTLIMFEECQIQKGEENLLEWMLDHHRERGCKLVLVSNQSHEGSQFTKGFGGIGALLRYEVEMIDENVESESEEWVY